MRFSEGDRRYPPESSQEGKDSPAFRRDGKGTGKARKGRREGKLIGGHKLAGRVLEVGREIVFFWGGIQKTIKIANCKLSVLERGGVKRGAFATNPRVSWNDDVLSSRCQLKVSWRPL